MIEFLPVPTDDFGAFPPEIKARAQESVKVWEVRYGPLIGSTDHTALLYFGLIPTNAVAAEGYLWAVFTREGLKTPLRVRLAAAREWRRFAERLAWTLGAFCSPEITRNRRFLRFLGFAECGRDDEHVYFVRAR